MKQLFFIFSVIALFVLAACGATNTEHPVFGSAQLSAPDVTIYKSPTCGCCVSYTAQLKERGYTVKTVMTNDMTSIKQQYHIPSHMESCHTAIIGDYFVEGHVPFEAVEQLLNDKPPVDGIALPDMPSGSPGMPGPKREPFRVYALTNGVATDYALI